LSSVPKDDPKNIFGWCMYDWANSAYPTTVASAILPVYFRSVVVDSPELRIFGFETSAIAIWAFVVAFSSFIAFISAPVLGAIADFSSARKRFLLFFAYGGVLFTTLLYFSGPGDIYRTLLLFILAQVGYIGSLVFYDSFLVDIAGPEKMDWISSKGYSYGYVGGGLQFALSLGLIAGHEYIGISESTAARLAILMAALWWAGFSLFTVKHLREAKTRPGRHYSLLEYARIGVSRTVRTALRVKQYRHLTIFLLAFMLYSDGIQTVIDMAAIYGVDELGISTTALMVTLLVIQIVASFGALLFGKLATRIGAKHTLMIGLVLWSCIITYVFFMQTATEFFVLGVIVGFVYGGSQALSRSFYGSMIPEGASAEFFGFYTVFSKFSAIWGPTTFFMVRQWLGSSRLAILSLIFFFVAGLVLMAFVDERKAREAKNVWTNCGTVH
jgi:UMF1 family MFS transporter